MRQVHSTVVAPAAPGQEPTADALVADLRGRGPLAVGVLTADCVPLLLASADGRLLAAVHAGRRGMCEGVVDAALGEMTRLGAVVPDILAALGPSICGASPRRCAPRWPPASRTAPAGPGGAPPPLTSPRGSVRSYDVQE